MDLMWPVLIMATAAVAVAAFVWHRKRQVERARGELHRAVAVLQNIEGALRSFVPAGDYIPELVRRPFCTEVRQLTEQNLPGIAKVLRRARDDAKQKELEGILRHATQLRRLLDEHNDRYVEQKVTEHSRLLVEELRLDEAQRTATVRDDYRNLVIAGAGSGKTRTIVARVRFLVERHVPAKAILAVTFTNKATEEMQDRLKQMGVPLADRGTEGVTVSTLHALGKRVVQAAAPGPISVADDRWADSLVAGALRDTRTANDPELAQLYLNAIFHFHRNELETAPAVGGDQTYRTLRGEHVRSIGERIIADFLFTHHVAYKYEAKAPWASVGAGWDAYNPDFTLLDSGACIEYWGINRAGEVPAGWTTPSAEYRKGMEWKRDQFRRAGKVLIEFFDYERTEGTLEAALRERLTRAGVVLQPMTLDELDKAMGDLKYVGSGIERLLVQFIANARALRRPPDEIFKLPAKVSPRVYHFGLLGIAVLRRYEATLAAEGRIDFSDMLHRAADILERGVNPLPKFQHILVDEFQDTSAAMARFLKALLAVTGARLFAVGDDWQAIYGFAGGDVDHILNFEKHFGPASTTMLSVNYRSPVEIVEAGAALIAHNDKQVPKEVVVASKERGEAYVHEVPDDDEEIVGTTIRLIQKERQQLKPDEILVLSRTNHLLEPIVEACWRNRVPVADPDRNVQGVRILSAHKAKGLEASVVIVANVSDHIFGFPSKVENPDVLGPVRMSTGDEKAEERRLFYVVITRAMKRLHIVARKGLPSPYIAEIEGSGVALKMPNPDRTQMGYRFGGEFHVERLYRLSERQAAAGIRQAGLLATPTSRFEFTSWAPTELLLGVTYWLDGVIKDRPFRGRERVKLDQGTSVVPRTQARAGFPEDGGRKLCPRPPASHRPRSLQP